ncbi:MAG: hypothetical protein IH588_08840 [Anaerolineales bacterium]|nr:hypothetical protein [Anaerolineales bacterium]
MRFVRILFLILMFTTLACQSTGTAAPSTPAPVSVPESTATPPPPPTDAFTATSTELPKGVIFVDTLEQEVYPFVENGKCSLAEAIIAANSGKARDTCAAGDPNETTIELMPGEYRFTQADHTPPQEEWTVSVVDVGSALPMLIRPLTIHGNGATLIRDESAEPFRFFEAMFGGLTLENLTLENGSVLDDWGGAIYSMNVSITMDSVRFVNNSADNGGAVYFTFGGLNITNCEFIGNNAGFAGGGLYADSAKVNISQTEFNGNRSVGQSGGLHAEGATLVIVDSIFVKNVNEGTRGGAVYATNVNLNVTRSQFYQNQSGYYGGAFSIQNPILAGIDPEEENPLDNMDQVPMIVSLMTSIPGFQSTLEAHPSGVFQDFHEDAQIHDSCFANNVTINPEDPNWTSGVLGSASDVTNNYWGDPSGPSGMGPGKGDSVGKRITFAPFLTEMPGYCDPALAQIEP